MSAAILNVHGDAALAAHIAHASDGILSELELRNFPDGETYVRIATPLTDADAILVSALDRPNEKMMPLWLTALAAKELGARRVLLVAPYLPYMRQDARFHAGEAVSARAFARLIGAAVDGLVTVDPHLHRIARLDELFPAASRVVHAAPALAHWVQAHVPHPLFIGPDSESEQWTAQVAELAQAPFAIASKRRLGDRRVEVSLPDIGCWRERTPVIVDDMISTAHTMIETVKILLARGFAAPWCVAVHGLFVEGAYEALLAAGAARVVTCNTVAHPAARIDVAAAIAAGVRGWLR